MTCPSCNADSVEGSRFCGRCGAYLPGASNTETPDDALIGHVLMGRYRITRLLDQEAWWSVYEAEHAAAGLIERVAIKILSASGTENPLHLAHFEQEFAILFGLEHPNTIRVFEYGPAPDNAFFIAQELPSGTRLSEELETRGPMPPDRVEHIVRQLCGSLAEVHEAGVVHRALTSESILLSNVGGDVDLVKLCNFGIAERRGEAGSKARSLVPEGVMLGSPPYMSPEQCMNKELDARSDIYSLALVAYEMLTGRPPFNGNTPWEWACRHLVTQPIPFEDSPSGADVPGKMKAAIMRAMAKDPAQRFSSAREFFEGLSSSG